MVNIVDMAKKANEPKKFKELKDIRDTGEIDQINLKELAENTINEMRNVLKVAGKENIEIKVVGVGIHFIMKNPDGEEMAHSQGVKWGKESGKLSDFDTFPILSEEDLRKAKMVAMQMAKGGKSCGGDCEDGDGTPYKVDETHPKKKYHGGMFG